MKHQEKLDKNLREFNEAADRVSTGFTKIQKGLRSVRRGLGSVREKLIVYMECRRHRHVQFLRDREDDLVFLLIFGMLTLHVWGKGLSSSLNEGLWWCCLGLALIVSLLRLVRTLRT